MRLRIALLALLLSCGPAWSAADCARSSLQQNEALSAYLLEYGRDCVDKRAGEELAQWHVAPGEEDVSKLIPVWYDLSDRFRALAARTPASKLSGAYADLAKRAASAGEALKADVVARARTSAARYGNVAWRLPQSTDPSDLLFLKTPDGPLIDIRELADRDCADAAAAVCRAALGDAKELMLHWRVAHQISNLVSQAFFDRLDAQVERKKKLWDRYLYGSKPMLPFDHVATDLLDGRWEKSDQYPEGLREPPDTQWFFVHPSAAMEYMRGAEEGQKFKPALLLEVFGANRWREDRRWFDAPGLRHLSGASLAVSYADRAGVRDTGVGVVLTFDNVYSVGLMRYQSKSAILLSLDLANLWRDKYRDRYESFRTGVKNKF